MIRGTLEHPKFLDLQVRLGVRRYQACGLLESLWHFTARYAPDGGVGKWPDEAIARALEWEGDPAALIGALVDSGWLDRIEGARLYVHDWHEHADDAVQRSLARAVRCFANGDQPSLARLSESERIRIKEEFVRAPSGRPTCAPRAPLPAPPRPAPSEPNKSAARRGRAAKCVAAPAKEKTKKPSFYAIGAYCEEFKAARGFTTTVPPRHQRELGVVYADLGEEEFRAALRMFFSLDKQWIRDASFSAGAFLGALQTCVNRVRGRAAFQASRQAAQGGLPLDPQPRPKPPADTAELENDPMILRMFHKAGAQ